METCVGCGSPVAPAWKFCIHCGLAIETPPVDGRPEIPGAIRPETQAMPDTRRRKRLLLLGGIGIFLIGVALLIVAITMFAGTLG